MPFTNYISMKTNVLLTFVFGIFCKMMYNIYDIELVLIRLYIYIHEEKKERKYARINFVQLQKYD
jgi:hypothetical protein